MRKNRLGRTGINAGAVAFGGIITTDETRADADRYVAWAADRGVNYFDVAPSYGNAQDMLGPALAPYRKNAYLACKTNRRDAKGAEEEFKNSLKVLQTDYFDVYQLHGLAKQQDVDAAFAPGGAMEFLLKMKEQGYIRNLGISAHNEDLALQALAMYDFATVLFPVNFALGLDKNWGYRLKTVLEYTDRGFLALKSLAHRQWLPDEERVYPKSWCKTIFGDDRLGVAALKYTLSMGVDTIVPPGNFEQFKFVCDHIDECIANPLNDADLAYLREEAHAVSNHHIFA